MPLTEQEARDLGQRAIVAGWKWVEGAKPFHGAGEPSREYRCVWWACSPELVSRDAEPIIDDDGIAWRRVMSAGGEEQGPAWGWPTLDSGWVPDFRDAATLGCLLALVEATYPDCFIVYYDAPVGLAADITTVGDGRSALLINGVAVLVAALEAAPGGE